MSISVSLGLYKVDKNNKEQFKIDCLEALRNIREERMQEDEDVLAEYKKQFPYIEKAHWLSKLIWCEKDVVVEYTKPKKLYKYNKNVGGVLYDTRLHIEMSVGEVAYPSKSNIKLEEKLIQILRCIEGSGDDELSVALEVVDGIKGHLTEAYF